MSEESSVMDVWMVLVLIRKEGVPIAELFETEEMAEEFYDMITNDVLYNNEMPAAEVHLLKTEDYVRITDNGM